MDGRIHFKEARESALGFKAAAARANRHPIAAPPDLLRLRGDCSKRLLLAVANEILIGDLENLPTMIFDSFIFARCKFLNPATGLTMGLARVNLPIMEAEKISSGRRLRLIFAVV
jgi:hypothetical protein